MDHRPLRKQVEAEAGGKALLNLFCYTASFSVYGAVGGASRVDSVDLSNTYLAWGERNFALNGLGGRPEYRFIRNDVATFLKDTKDSLDINRDWHKLVNGCLDHLNPGGTVYFSTNSRQLKFDAELLAASKNDGEIVVKDITAATIPEDFRNQKIHRCWKISLKS